MFEKGDLTDRRKHLISLKETKLNLLDRKKIQKRFTLRTKRARIPSIKPRDSRLLDPHMLDKLRNPSLFVASKPDPEASKNAKNGSMRDSNRRVKVNLASQLKSKFSQRAKPPLIKKRLDNEAGRPSSIFRRPGINFTNQLSLMQQKQRAAAALQKELASGGFGDSAHGSILKKSQSYKLKRRIYKKKLKAMPGGKVGCMSLDLSNIKKEDYLK